MRFLFIAAAAFEYAFCKIWGRFSALSGALSSLFILSVYFTVCVNLIIILANNPTANIIVNHFQ